MPTGGILARELLPTSPFLRLGGGGRAATCLTGVSLETPSQGGRLVWGDVCDSVSMVFVVADGVLTVLLMTSASN